MDKVWVPSVDSEISGSTEDRHSQLVMDYSSEGSLVEGKVALELKAVIELRDAHLAQAINYLEAFDLAILSSMPVSC